MRDWRTDGVTIMQTLRRTFIWLVILIVLLLAGSRLFLRSPRGMDWLARRLSSHLGATVGLDAADLRLPGVLWIGGLYLAETGTCPETARWLEVAEVRLGWRGRRLRVELTQPEIVLADRDGRRWHPAVLSPFSLIAESGVIDVLESVSERFRQRWDWSVRGGRAVATSRGADKPVMLMHELSWSLTRVSLPGRSAWHQAVSLYDWAGGPSNAVSPTMFAWLSLGDGQTLTLPDRMVSPGGSRLSTMTAGAPESGFTVLSSQMDGDEADVSRHPPPAGEDL